MAGKEDAEKRLANMARAARKVGPNDRVVELRKVRPSVWEMVGILLEGFRAGILVVTGFLEEGMFRI